MYSHRLRILPFFLLSVLFLFVQLFSVSAVEPAYPSCPAGSTQLVQFGPTDQAAVEVFSLVGRKAWPTVKNFNSTFTSGSMVVWQGEGHNWNFDCKEGPDNDPAFATACDLEEPNEIAQFFVNDVKIGQFIDHNPDDDRQFLYTFPISNLVNGNNKLSYEGIVNTSQETAVFVKGVICGTNPPTPTRTPTPSPTKTPVPTAIPTPAAPDTPVVSTPACITEDYTGSGITVTWANNKVNLVQISGDKDFAYFPSSKAVTAGTTSTTAPSGFQFFGDPLKLKAGAPYFVRTNNGINSQSAPFTIPLCSPTATPAPLCPTKASGDANCDGQISLADFEFWRREFQGAVTTKNADFNNSAVPDLADFEIWRSNAFSGV